MARRGRLGRRHCPGRALGDGAGPPRGTRHLLGSFGASVSKQPLKSTTSVHRAIVYPQIHPTPPQIHLRHTQTPHTHPQSHQTLTDPSHPHKPTAHPPKPITPTQIPQHPLPHHPSKGRSSSQDFHKAKKQFMSKRSII